MAHGVYLIGAGSILAVMCWLIPKLLVKVVESDIVGIEQVPPLARWVLEHRDLMPLMALPAVVLGFVELNKKMPLRILWTLLGLLAMLAPAGLLIYTFVVSIGLLYQMPDL